MLKDLYSFKLDICTETSGDTITPSLTERSFIFLNNIQTFVLVYLNWFLFCVMAAIKLKDVTVWKNKINLQSLLLLICPFCLTQIHQRQERAQKFTRELVIEEKTDTEIN